MKTAYKNKNKRLQGNPEPNMKTLKHSKGTIKYMKKNSCILECGKFKKINGAPGSFVKFKHQRKN